MAQILVVDDEESIRALIQEILILEGYCVDTASTGAEALEKLRMVRYQLVILDRKMPVMTGIETLTALRTDPEFKNVKVLMCTAAGVIREVEEAFSAGANGYFIKPLRREILIKKVQALLAD